MVVAVDQQRGLPPSLMAQLRHARVHMIYRELTALLGSKYFLVLGFQLPQIMKDTRPVDRCPKARRQRRPVEEGRLRIPIRISTYSLNVFLVFLRFDAASLAAAMCQRIVLHGRYGAAMQPDPLRCPPAPPVREATSEP